ncbi:uncharacterized protein [Montipora foliosa]|uniref:uncharacterized protein n=1 Tax=Montipora foliosa TaxID=591990 RepID=UPI0035F18554
MHPLNLIVYIQNVQLLYNLEEDVSLWKELHDTSLEEGKLAFGVVLISEKVVCRLCGRKLTAKVITVVNVIIYHDIKGTFMGCRIPKMCSNRLCNLTQHYGYYTVGDKKFFDEDWDTHEYFACTHKGNSPGCKTNLVIDGNFDNNRECCMGKGCGFIQYDSLPGEVKTGCTQTPKLGKRFCVEHLLDHKGLDEIDPCLKEVAKEFEGCLGPVLRSASKKVDVIPWGQEAEILETRTLRNKKFFKVFTGNNYSDEFEKTLNIPAVLQENFEAGQKELTLTLWDKCSVYGVTSVRSYQVPESEEVPIAKRRKCTGNKIIPTGMRDDKLQHACPMLIKTIFIDTPQDRVVNCKTEKSKHVQRKTFRTEERIVYDDACHLKKYANNPLRWNVTRVSEKLADLDMVVDKMHFRNHVDR